jgi:hypothetical protein
MMMTCLNTSLMYYGSVTRFDSLEDVIRWGFAHDHEIVEVIVQDEFTHDVVMRTADTFHVFDTT